MRAVRHPVVRTVGLLVLLFAVGLFVSDRLIDAFGEHWWIAPFRFGPVMAYIFLVLARPETQA